MKYSCRPVWIEIDTDFIIHNIKEIKKFIGGKTEIIAVIKGDAYGFGAIEIAKTIITAGVKYLAVATVDEGIELRHNQIEVPILVLGYIGKSQIKDAIDHNLSMTIYHKEVGQDISDYAQKKGVTAKVHVKINTGLNRIGILPKESIEFVKYILSLKNIKIEGIFTQLGSPDPPDQTNANHQSDIFNDLIKSIKSIIKNKIIIHAASSWVIIDIPSAHFDAVRPGRLIFGLSYPNLKNTLNLKNSLSIRTVVVQIYKIKAGEGVGYNIPFRPKKDTLIATLPIGFTDGLVSKQIENKLSVIVGGKKRKIVSVCADMCMIELGFSLNDISIGDVVTLVGNQNGIEITVQEIASISKTSLAGVLTTLSRRLPRIYLRNNIPYLMVTPIKRKKL